MGADGLREGAAETVDWPVVPPPAASVISDRERGAPPFVRLVTSDAMRPITGVNDAVGAFSPALIEVDGAHVLCWSEDLGDRTRIWGALPGFVWVTAEGVERDGGRVRRVGRGSRS